MVQGLGITLVRGDSQIRRPWGAMGCPFSEYSHNIMDFFYSNGEFVTLGVLPLDLCLLAKTPLRTPRFALDFFTAFFSCNGLPTCCVQLLDGNAGLRRWCRQLHGGAFFAAVALPW